MQHERNQVEALLSNDINAGKIGFTEADKVRSALNEDLGKWPQAFLRGETLTQEQATEVILRISGLHWEAYAKDSRLARALGIARQDHEDAEEFSQLLDKLGESIQEIPLEYLDLPLSLEAVPRHQLGWLDWNGIIHYDRGLGKWPGPEELYLEWRALAEAFPFLRLYCQVSPDFYYLSRMNEGYESEPPAMTFLVEKGRVRVEPGAVEMDLNMRDPEPLDFTGYRLEGHRSRVPLQYVLDQIHLLQQRFA